MDFGFFHDFLSIDSTSGKERKVAEWLSETLPGMFPAANRPVLRVDEVGDGTLNLLLTWGVPRIVFCSHLDTVPPYIPPTFPDRCPVAAGHDDDTDSFASLGMTAHCHSKEGEARRRNLFSSDGLTIRGRGSCDAKGQVFAMVTACQRLAEEGKADFGLLLLAGEETGSWGAKAFAKTDFRAPYLVVGEPTDNCMVSASKGTKSFDLKFTGEAFHSGYPQYGVSAVDLFVNFVNKLRAKDFGLDPVLGETTWNIGLVHSDNPQNILSPELTCRIYFRTTFVSDEAVCKWMASLGPKAGTDSSASLRNPIRAYAPESVPASGRLTVTPRGGDTPATYWTVEGLPSKPVAFGSDAPHLKNFTHKAICGPGSITVAHRDDEHVLIAELEKAVEQYLVLYSTALGTE
ncbi:MAG: M20/M25/M40 family metallo-hydrolase [Bacteroidales bacterium]|nr:M20/M25/M40 family metallo-hydrolase [Bacteroidales bacterium]